MGGISSASNFLINLMTNNKQSKLRGLERVLEASINGTKRLPVKQEKELQDEIVRLRNQIFEGKMK